MWRGDREIDPRFGVPIIFFVMYVLPFVVRSLAGYDASN